jgi:hypothetical protein
VIGRVNTRGPGFVAMPLAEDYRVEDGRAYWDPGVTLRARGARHTALGPHGPAACAKAEELNRIYSARRRTR